MADFFRDWLDNNLHQFDFPSAYLGTEPGAELRDWDSAPFRLCIVGGSTYQNLAGNLAVPMLVRMTLEKRPDWVVERAFFPCTKRDLQLFEKNRIPMFSLESKHRLSEFDALAFSCSFQGVDMNVIKMLSLSRIPIKRVDRQADADDLPWILRGGQNDGNPTPFMPIYDILYIGEAEVNLLKLLDVLALAKTRNMHKDEVKKAVTKIQGILVPDFYESQYEDGKFKGWQVNWEKAPFPVQAARFKEMDEQYVYSHPISNYLEEMGSGELLISRGCLASCAFCMEGHKEKPYREMGVDRLISAIGQNYKESGARSVTLSAFCVSSFRQKRTVLKRLLEEVTDEVGLTSQRVDESARDPEFMEWTALAGNRSVSFGVEGTSERLRMLVNKWAPEKDILQAVDNAIKGGYNKIKFFMISNLPTESDEDRAELVELAGKIRKVRDKYPARKVQMRFNWTDLTITAQTPFQFLKPLMGGRHLKPFLKDLQNLGFRVGFGSGKGRDLDSILQLLHISDDRLCDPLIELVTSKDIVYFRQVGKNSFDVLEEMLEKRGLSTEMWWRDKDKDEFLSWDIVSFGITKDKLWKQLQDNLGGKQIPKCDEACRRCGVSFCTGMEHLVREEDNIARPKPISLVPVNQHIVMKLNVKGHHRFLSASARKQLVRRLLYLHDVPIMKDIEVASDTIRTSDWVTGVDYAAVRLTGRLKAVPELKSLALGFDVDDVVLRNTTASKVLGDNVICHSEIKVSHALKLLTKLLEQFLSGMNTKMKIRVDTYFGQETMEVDGAEMVRDAWIIKRADGFWLNLLHKGSISIYDFYGHLTKKFWRQVAGIEAHRVNFYVEQELLGALVCDECHQPFVYTLFGDKVCISCTVPQQVNA